MSNGKENGLTVYILLIIWLFISTLFIVIFIPFIVPSDAGPFSNTLDAINVIATAFIIGISFSLSSTILVSRNESDSRGIFWSIGMNYLIVALYMSVLSIIITISYTVSFVQILGILLASLVVGLIPSVITYVIAHYFEDWRYSLIINTGIFLVMSQIFGYLPQQLQMGMSSLYSLYHLYRFLAVILSGYQFDNITQMQNALGIGVEPVQVVGPLFVWMVVAILSLLLHRFRIKRSLEQEAQTSVDSSPQMFSIPVSKQHTVVALLVSLLILSGISYSWNISPPIDDEPETYDLYSSPVGGDTMVLGQWWAVFVEFPETLQHGYARYHLLIEVLDWGTVQAPRLIAIQFAFEDMTLSQFEALNESERNEEFAGQHVGLSDDQLTLDTGWTSYWIDEGRLWAHRMSNQGVYQGGAEFRVNIIISARA